MSVLAAIRDFAVHTVEVTGYPGISMLMGLNSMCIPIPSEAIMPTGGILAAKGTLSLPLVALSGAVGTTIGSSFAYLIGAKVGKDVLLKYGKYILIREKEMAHAEAWFEKYGLAAAFFGRMVPVVQTFISLPAGIYKADFKKFVLYTFLGAAPWSFLWAAIGFWLQNQMTTIDKYMHYLDYVVLLIILAFVTRMILKRRNEKAEA